MLNVERVVQLPAADSGLQLGIARLHNHYIDSKRQDRNRFFRREALCITNTDNHAWIIRYAMGGGGVKGLCKDVVGLDYDGIDALGLRINQPGNIVVRRARRLEVIRWLATFPDLSIRLSIQLGLLGAGLGLLGFAIGLISIF